MSDSNSHVHGFDLDRFVQAQAAVYPDVLTELRAGLKRTHWMWFVFPQLRGLGRSATAHRYGLRGRAEATAYWRHPLLGSRVRECTQRVLQVPEKSALAIFGSPDNLKFHSCMTLFAAVADHEEPAFSIALQRFYAGQTDELTLRLLEISEQNSKP